MELIEHRASIIDLGFVQWDSVINSLLADFNTFFYDEVLMQKNTSTQLYVLYVTESNIWVVKVHCLWKCTCSIGGKKGVKDERRYIEVTPDRIMIG